MRVVHFGKYYPPEMGGIENVTRSLAEGVASAGNPTTVVCFAREPRHRDESTAGVCVRRVPIAIDLASQPLGWRYLRECVRLGRRADIVHLHAPNMLAAVAALLAGPRPRIVVHWHSDVVDKGWLGKLLAPLERALLRRADAIACTSRAYADASPTLTPFAHKIAVVPLGVRDAAATAPQAAPEELPPALSGRIGGRKVVLSVGRMVPYKGFHLLVEAARELADDAVIVLAGTGPLEHDIRALAERRGVSDRIIVTGRIEPATLDALFRMATVFCLPSVVRAEAFGVVLIEAMSHGLPLVATRIAGSGVPWVNAHGESGLNVAVGDAQALAQACNDILASPQLRQRLGTGARQRFLSEFTEAIFIKRTLALYRRVIEGMQP
jgi:glycosyltransferase involved in cell wall biosynthesis